MADITARLVWYRLGECYNNLGEKYERFLEWWNEDFSWRRVDLLDMLFLGWLVAAFVVVGAINLYLRFFGLPKGKGRQALTSHPAATVKGGESVQWINSALSWLYLHYNSTPELVESWLRALNEQARKHPCEYQVKFDRVQAGSVPPKFTQVSTDVSTDSHITLVAGVEVGEMTLLVSAIQQSATNIKVATCDVTIAKLHGQLKIHSQYGNEEIQTAVQFVQPPDLQVKVKARNYENNVNTASIEAVVRSTLCEVVTHISLPSKGGYPNLYGAGRHGEYAGKPDKVESKPAKTTNLLGSPGQRGSASMKDKRLLVKVIKANGLGDKDFGCSDPYCLVQMDEPQQKHTTSVVKNTVNPFWDEHFLFDLDEGTKQVKFEVFDREKPPGDDFLGRAVLPMSELRRLPSSRQIIPLTGKPGSATTTSGSVTIEFLFMEPAEGVPLGAAGAIKTDGESLSPRRRIETSQRVTPGGTTVTTTTTTTERPKDRRAEAGYNESPSRIEKTESGSNYTSEYSPFSSRSSQLGAHEAGLTGAARRSGASPRLTVTPSAAGGSYGYGQTTESSPNEDLYRQDETNPEAQKDMKKSRSFASTLRRRFHRSPKNKRSQSADRAASMREGSLLKPPEHNRPMAADELGSTEIPEDGLRKSRSNSFSSSLKKLFKKKKKDGIASRESSVSRASTRSQQGVMVSESPQPQPRDASRVRSSSSDYGRPSYSSSVPAVTSPLYDQYNSH